MGRVHTIIKSTCSLIFIIHIIQLGFTTLYPELPDIKSYKKELKDIDFPVSFMVCLNEPNKTNGKFRDFGYNDLYAFFNGESMFNSSIIGWSGHKRNGLTFESVEGKYYTSLSLETFKYCRELYTIFS